jgi:anti-sigma B factor antagonist
MRIHADETLYSFGPFALPGLTPGVVCRKIHDVAVVDLAGPLVAESPASGLRDRILELLQEGTRNFAINLAEAPYADSYGLGSLAGAYNLVRDARGRIKFFAASERLVRTLRTLRLDTVFELFEDEASALSSFG